MNIWQNLVNKKKTDSPVQLSDCINKICQALSVLTVEQYCQNALFNKQHGVSMERVETWQKPNNQLAAAEPNDIALSASALIFKSWWRECEWKHAALCDRANASTQSY